ncbi:MULTISPECIES: hydrogenase expression/formation protein HypE [Paraburkholderia]|uniref:Hydrogenase expression/formation protein HypE n=2 Tax=Paraburkholderia TaxID=1822464 RepID=A0A7Y9WI06_9BURK|nr:hydrogenase expression/formation protein HypE [Paraburkholderia bryophila]NYH20228.1 hydrogenase expression/formation protein HypE [Paraburkholderia bryophila]NYH20743.1 hydrogenase expression/formation protein HypE [Paraburkholderia bryophila]
MNDRVAVSIEPGEPRRVRPPRRVNDVAVNLAHGSGGRAMRDLIEDVFVSAFDNPTLAALEDQAVFALADLAARGDRLAFTTDSYVVDPLFFPGGDIGTLAVSGTVNDLAVCGATPLYLSCAVVIEEGLAVDVLRRVAASMQRIALEAGVAIVTGDTKVVERGCADKLFVNTAGIGVVRRDVSISARNARPGDVVIVNGFLGDHGAAILVARQQLALDADIKSDCCPLNGLIAAMLDVCPRIHCLRDATRGGVATVLNEFAQSSRVRIRLDETALPLREPVQGACEILGLDPLYLANEGKLVAVVPADAAQQVLTAMRAHPAGREAAVIGTVEACDEGAEEGLVVMQTTFGGQRIVDMLVGEQLPRIC